MDKFIERVKKIITNEYFLLAIIVFFGLLIRLYKINNPIADWHSWRQADTASVSRTFFENGISFLYPKYHDVSSIQSGIDNPQGYRMVEFPIYNAVHVILSKNFTNLPGSFSLSFDSWGRLTSVFFALASSIVLFLVGKKIYGSKVGLVAASVFLFLPFNIYFTRVVLPEPLGVFLGLMGIYMGMEYLYDKNKSILFLFLSSLFFALSLLIKPYFVFYAIPLVYLLSFKKVKIDKKVIIFGVLAFIPILLWRYWVSMYPEGIPFYKWAFNGDRLRFHPAFFRWIFGERLGILILGGWGLIPFVFGLLDKTKNKFALWFLIAMGLYVTAVSSANIRHDYYQILVIPAVALVTALGFVKFWEKSRILLFLTVLVMFLISWDRIRPFYKINHPEIIEAGQAIDQLTPKDARVIAPYNGDTAFLYQTKRWGWPAVDNSINNIIERGADYYVSVDLLSTDTTNFEERFKTLERTDKYIILDLNKER